MQKWGRITDFVFCFSFCFFQFFRQRTMYGNFTGITVEILLSGFLFMASITRN